MIITIIITRKIISGSGGNHPKGSIAALYLARNNGGRGLKSVEEEYKNIKTKTAVKLYENTDPKMTTVREFEEKSLKSGRHSFNKDAQKFALIKEDGELTTGSKVKACLDTVRQQQYQAEMEQEKRQWKLLKNRWDDNNLNREGCFVWLHHWKTAPTRTVTGLQELYQQLLRTKAYQDWHERKCRRTLPYVW